MFELAKTFWNAVERLVYDGGLANAGNIALSLLLSVFPFMMLIAVFADIWGDPKLLEEVLELTFSHWPAGTAAPIAEQIKVVLSKSGAELFSFSTAIALVLATNGVESARDGLNRAYRFKESRGFIWRRLQGAVFVLVGVLGLITTAFILVGTPIVWNFLITRFEPLQQFAFIVGIAQYGIAFAILACTLFGFHYFLPDGRHRFGELVWGILITILGVVIGSQLFAYYLQTFADYQALYAGLAGVMVAIIYLYCLSVLILFGAEFNASLLEWRKSRKG
ncbi:MAG: YihY/virulence factor BrkB family protein [Rhizobiaceae bacterium]|nr:YihY/virulence factor BrkB family protein [Rhizobiaceae bacterium]